MIAKLWAHRTLFLTGVIIVAVAFIAFVVITFTIGTFKTKVSGVPAEFRGGTAYLALADSAAERTQGLSGVKKLAVNEGLLMDFQADNTWGIWMKDMYIPLDILWLTKEKEVIYMVKDVRPELSTSKTFKPDKPARYVIELPSGAADRYMVRVGDVVRFKE